MNFYKRVLTIAGSDSGAGAGIQADIKTISALGCYAHSVITAITAQNTIGVDCVQQLGVDIVRRQLVSVLDDIGADAIKIGMLASGDIANVVADVLGQYPTISIVLDPVLVATSSDALADDDVVEVITKRLIPMATIVTPNLPETYAISGVDIKNNSNVELAWRSFQAMGARALLLKGGHNPIDGVVTDWLCQDNEMTEFKNDYVDTLNTHGTGCTLSSAIASYLALGFELKIAVEYATKYVHHAIASAAEYKIGHGHGPVHHFFKYW